MLKIVKNAALVAVVGFGLSACANIYDDAKMAAPKGDAYSKALYTELMKLADIERYEEDWTDANYYGSKAVAAANGQSVAAAKPASRGHNIYGNKGIPTAELNAAYSSLNGQLTGGGPAKDPVAMAKAFAGYECMLEQSEEGHQADDIAACKNQFNEAMGILTYVPAAPGVCYYPTDVSAVDFECQKAISAIAEEAAKGGQVIIQGYADSVGDADYNLELSKRRAQGVVEVLNQLGISTDNMTVGAVGEAEQRVATADGVPEQENRAVEMRVVVQ
jgi:OOP family OmpA-OmpF porin